VATDPTGTDVTIYTTPWCGPCRALKAGLDRLGITYAVIDIERDPDGARLVEEANNGLQKVPTVLFADGGVLTNPSAAQVSDRLAETAPASS
jgi:mycoredoxin